MRKLLPRKAGRCALLGAALLLAGICFSPSSATAAPERTDLKVGYVAQPRSMDPHQSSDTLTWLTLLQMYDCLIRIEPDGSLTPWLAESWKITDGGKTILFKIRKGVKFHNGDTMTTEDVAYSLNRSIANPATIKFTKPFDKAEALDDTTVKVSLRIPYAPVLFCVANPCMSIISKAAAEKYGKDFALHPVGTGAFKFVEWKTGERMVFTRFDDFWRGPIALKDLTIRFIANPSTATISLEKGEVDFLFDMAPADVPTVKDAKNLTLVTGPGAGCFHVTFNNGKESVFSNQKLRQAVSYAIDREAFLYGGFDGNGFVDEFPGAPAGFGYNPDFKQNPFDLEKAKKLLAEAGYKPGQLTVRIRTNEHPLYAKPCEILQESLRQMGINATLELLERATYLEEVTRKFNYDITIYQITASIPDTDYMLYTRLHSSMFGGGNNFSQTNIPELDAVLDKARVEQNPDVRKKLYTDAAQIIKDTAVFIPLIYGRYNNAYNAKLKNVPFGKLNYYYFYDYSW